MINLCGIQSSILDRRAHGEVISLVVTNPRITEWLYAGNLSPDSSQMPSAELTVCKSVTCEMLPLDKGHFITADKHILQITCSCCTVWFCRFRGAFPSKQCIVSISHTFSINSPEINQFQDFFFCFLFKKFGYYFCISA